MCDRCDLNDPPVAFSMGRLAVIATTHHLRVVVADSRPDAGLARCLEVFDARLRLWLKGKRLRVRSKRRVLP